MNLQPFAKQGGDFVRQAQCDPTRGAYTFRTCISQNAFYEGVGDRWHNRRDRNVRGDASLCQCFKRRDAFGGGRGAWFEQAGKLWIKAGHRDRHSGEAILGELCQQVEIPQHPV